MRRSRQVPGSVHTDLLAAGLSSTRISTSTRPTLAWIGTHGLAVQDDVRLTPPRRRRRACRPGLRGSGHRRHGHPERRRRRPHRQHAPQLPLRRPTALRDGERTRSPSTSPPAARRRPRSAATGRRPAGRRTRTRTTWSARWPATSAGTGDPTWRPPGSGGRCASQRWRVARLASRASAGVRVDGTGRRGRRRAWSTSSWSTRGRHDRACGCGRGPRPGRRRSPAGRCRRTRGTSSAVSA